MIRIRWAIAIVPMTTVVGADDDDVSNRRAVFVEICFGTVCESCVDVDLRVATCFCRNSAIIRLEDVTK